jgi:hypothetical protein
MDELKGFQSHGIIFTGSSGNQAIGDCIFCGKRGKLYANRDNRLWDCKVCGKKGDFYEFLRQISILYKDQLGKGDLIELSQDRGLPTSAFSYWDVGLAKDGVYAIPIKNANGKVVDIRTYRIGGKLFSTPGVQTGLFGAHRLGDESSKKDIWLCEGEWDAIAMQWLVNHVGGSGVVVGVPGANTFKREWVGLFGGKTVNVLYDNDTAGENGEITVADKLSGVAKELRFLHWSDKLPAGYDVRDLVKDYKKEAYKYILERLKGHTRSKSRTNASGAENPTTKTREEEGQGEEKTPKISTKELMENYKKWLHLPNTDVLKIMYGAIIANKLGGDPVWMFLVAPPGGSKSELLMSLSDHPEIHPLTSLTPHTLISGTSWQGGKDPSLLPQLNGKILVIKDFTTLLTMHYSQRDEIFGTLRDIYDGNTEKVFGNGIKRTYNVRFGIIAGVTPVIETFNIMHSSLGERFLKFRITGNWDQANEDAKIARALSNLGREDTMRDELKKITTWYLKGLKVPVGGGIPRISAVYLRQISALAKFSARLRGVVDRDKYSGMVMYKPSSEVGTRLAKQIAKLGMGIAIFAGKKEIDEHTYRLMRRVALDTVPDRSEDIVQAMWDIWCEKEEYCTTSDIMDITRLPQSTVFRLLQDLNLLKIVNRKDREGKATWSLSEYIMGLIKDGDIYENKNKNKK